MASKIEHNSKLSPTDKVWFWAVSRLQSLALNYDQNIWSLTLSFRPHLWLDTLLLLWLWTVTRMCSLNLHCCLHVEFDFLILLAYGVSQYCCMHVKLNTQLSLACAFYTSLLLAYGVWLWAITLVWSMTLHFCLHMDFNSVLLPAYEVGRWTFACEWSLPACGVWIHFVACIGGHR